LVVPATLPRVPITPADQFMPPSPLPLAALQGKPARLAAFPRALCLDFGVRGAGQSLTDDELVAACSLLGGRLLALDISGAFQLSTAGVQRALLACPALRQLAADGSTLQDAAFAVLLSAAAFGQGGSAGTSSSNSSGTAMTACLSLSSCRLPVSIGSPLQQLESLSLRGCLFLRGGLLADLAAACPRLASLDVAGCGLALK
jgi:hypothetical protein